MLTVLMEQTVSFSTHIIDFPDILMLDVGLVFPFLHFDQAQVADAGMTFCQLLTYYVCVIGLLFK